MNNCNSCCLKIVNRICHSRSNLIWTAICLLNILITQASAADDELSRIIDLNRDWKFEIGDNPEWINPLFDDDQWEMILVPSIWEEEGFPGYDGYGWYRIHFSIDPIYKDKVLYLIFGKIDDVDETYLNGYLVGHRGSLPPDFITWAHSHRRYRLNNICLNFEGDNVLAVKVFDYGGVGGIKSGKNGIYIAEEVFVPDLDLSGTWKFQQGDDRRNSDPEYSDADWQTVPVPAPWSLYGLRDYDGFGWYRKRFFLNHDYEGKQLIFLLGKIDDIDQVFLNGQHIGKTGMMDDNPDYIQIRDEDWQTQRAYTIPKKILNIGGENLVSIRVYDGNVNGGIYDGPIGITTRERYQKWYKRNKSFFDFIFD
jgi:sialate O-acetylesterase